LSISLPKIHQHPPFFTGPHLKITACNKKIIKKEKEKAQQLPPVQASGRSKLQQPKGLETKTTLTLKAKGKTPARGGHNYLRLFAHEKHILNSILSCYETYGSQYMTFLCI